MLNPEIDARDPIVISGMGPGGLAAAVMAARQGLPVIIVENRDHFSRVQRLHADGKTMAFLESLRDPNNPLDTKFFEEQCFSSAPKRTEPISTEPKDTTETINTNQATSTQPKNTGQDSSEEESSEEEIFQRTPDAVVELKDIQAFLERKLIEFSKQPNARIEIRRGKGHEITQIDPVTQTVSLKKPDGTIEDGRRFSHAIAADGARGGLIKLLNGSKSEGYQVNSSKIDVQTRQADVGTMSVQAKEGAKLPKTEFDGTGVNFKVEHLKRLSEMGWEQPYLPKCRVFRNEEGTKFFYSGEIPKAIKNMPKDTDEQKALQKQALAEWGKFAVSVVMELNENDLEVPTKAKEPVANKDGEIDPDAQKKYERSKEKDNLRTTAFELELYRSDKAVLKLGQGGAFALVGDAFQNANFFYGHGLNDAIQSGIKMVQCIDGKDTFRFDEFEQNQRTQAKSLDIKMSYEYSSPDIDNALRNITKSHDQILSLAGKMNDRTIEENIKTIKSLDKPGKDGFNGNEYAKQMQILMENMKPYAQKKLDEQPNKKKGAFTSWFGDDMKYVKMKQDVESASSTMNQSLTQYLKFNTVSKEKLDKQAEYSDKSKKSKRI
jgi:2-polyprenyl-6-methoxyphenol hydroxylase-like FAD-dependent oxidoreductase